MIAAGVSLLALTLLATINVALRYSRSRWRDVRGCLLPRGDRHGRRARLYPETEGPTSSWTSSRRRSRRRFKRVLDRVSYALILVFFSVVSWQTFVYGRGSCGRASCPETLKIAYYPFVFPRKFRVRRPRADDSPGPV